MSAKTGAHRGSIQLAVQREFLRKAAAVTDCAAATIEQPFARVPITYVLPVKLPTHNLQMNSRSSF